MEKLTGGNSGTHLAVHAMSFSTIFVTALSFLTIFTGLEMLEVVSVLTINNSKVRTYILVIGAGQSDINTLFTHNFYLN